MKTRLAAFCSQDLRICGAENADIASSAQKTGRPEAPNLATELGPCEWREPVGVSTLVRPETP